MKPAEAARAVTAGSVLLDLRKPSRFVAEHVPASVSFQFNRADLADRAEIYLPRMVPFIVIADNDVISDTAVGLLSDAGFEVAMVEGGVRAWRDDGCELKEFPSIDVGSLVDQERVHVVDVRESFEYDYAHVPGSVLHPSMQSWDLHAQLPDELELAFICADEARSIYVASLAAKQGKKASLVRGGMSEWFEKALPVEGTLARKAN